MLQRIRDNAQGTASKVIVSVIIFSFAAWGIGSLFGVGGEAEVATINGEKITESEFFRAVELQRRRILDQMGDQVRADQLDENQLKRTVLEGLVSKNLLAQDAEAKQLALSDTTIDQLILSLPQFQTDGKFDRVVFESSLRMMGQTPQGFRQLLREEYLISQPRNAISRSAFVTEAELDSLVALDGQIREFDHLKISPDLFADNISIGEEEARNYYDENPQQFTRQEQVRVAYLVLDKAALGSQVELSDQELAQRYETETADLSNREERDASHILVTGEGLSKKEQEDRVAAVVAALSEGQAFADVAKEYSDDIGTASQGGALGFAGRDTFVKPFEDVLFAMNPGEVSDPVKTGFGYHIIKLNGVREQEIPGFDEMRPQLEAALREEKAEELYLSHVETLSALSYEEETLEPVASEFGLEIRVSPPFGREGGDGLFADPRLVSSAFSEEVLSGNHNSDLIELADQAVTLHLEEYIPSELKPFESVEDDIVDELTRMALIDEAAALGEELIGAIRQGEDPATKLAEYGLEWQPRGTVERFDPEVEPMVSRLAFSLPKPQENQVSVGGEREGDGSFRVVRLFDVLEGGRGHLDEDERAAMAGMIGNHRGQLEYDEYRQSLRRQAVIETY